MIMKPAPEDMPFSPKLLELYQAFQRAPHQQARSEIGKEMAAVFASEWDPTDNEASEEYHHFFETYEKAALKYDLQADRLSRLAVNLISGFLTQNDTTIEELIPTVTTTAN